MRLFGKKEKKTLQGEKLPFLTMIIFHHNAEKEWKIKHAIGLQRELFWWKADSLEQGSDNHNSSYTVAASATATAELRVPSEKKKLPHFPQIVCTSQSKLKF